MTSSIPTIHTTQFITVKYGTLKQLKSILPQDSVISAMSELVFTSQFDHTQAKPTDLVQIPCQFLKNNATALVTKKIRHRLLLAHLIRKKELHLADYLISSLKQQSLLLDLQNKYGESTLHSAVRYGEYKAVKQLIENNANVNLPRNNGVTPLFSAVQHNKTNVGKLLLEHHANPNLQVSNGYSPGIYAKIKQSPLLELFPPQGPFKELYYRLVLATIFGMEGQSHYLSDDINLNAINLEGCFPQCFEKLLNEVIREEISSSPTNALDLSTLADLFTFAINVQQCPSAEILSRLLSGKPTMLPIGFKEHTIMLLIHPEYTENRVSHFRLAIANRGALSQKPVEFWTIRSENLTEAVIQKLLNLDSIKEDLYQETLKVDIWNELQCDQTKDDILLEEQCTLKEQYEPNCSWISTITVIWAFLALKNEGQSHLKEKTDAYYDHLVSKATNHMVGKYINKHINGSLRGYQIDRRILNHIYKFYIQEGNSRMENLCKDLLQEKSHFPSRNRTNARNRSYTYQPY